MRIENRMLDFYNNSSKILLKDHIIIIKSENYIHLINTIFFVEIMELGCIPVWDLTVGIFTRKANIMLLTFNPQLLVSI